MAGHTVVVGGYGVGFSFFAERAPEDGETVSGARMSEEHGGKASNQAVCLSRLGANVTLLTAVGKDRLGDEAFDLWREEGVNASLVERRTGSTMSACIITDASAENRILLADGVLSEYDADSVNEHRDAFTGASFVLVSCEVTLPAVQQALRLGRESGATVVLNPAPAPALSADDWENIDIVTPNRTEAIQLLQTLAPESPAAAGTSALDIAQTLARRGQVSVVITDGGDGAILATPDSAEASRIPTPTPAQVVDTTGAGDAFNAGLVAALGAGYELAEAVRVANHIGSLEVEHEGVIGGMPTSDTLAARYGIRIN